MKRRIGSVLQMSKSILILIASCCSFWSCTLGPKFWAYCDVRVENSTGQALTSIVLTTTIGSGAGDVSTTDFGSLDVTEVGQYQKIKMASSHEAFFGNTEWEIISDCMLSYSSGTTSTVKVFTGDTSTGNVDRGTFRENKKYTLIVDGNGVTVHLDI